MALHHRAEAVVEVEVLVAVDVPDVGALAAGQVDRPRVARLIGGRNPANEAPLRPRVELPGALRALVESRRLTLGELLEASAIDLDVDA